MVTAQTDKYIDTCIDIKNSQEATDPCSLPPFQKQGLYPTTSLFFFQTLPPYCVFQPELAVLLKAGLAALLLRSPQDQT